MTASVVIFAIGNPSRGDDALGPHLLARLSEWLTEEGLGADFELIEDFQLQIEHALDLRERRLALFIDAGERTPAPFVFTPVAPSAGLSHTSHALSPAAVLQVYTRTENSLPPPAFLLAIRAESFELGEALSESAQEFADSAFALLTRLCQHPSLDAWRAVTRC